MWEIGPFSRATLTIGPNPARTLHSGRVNDAVSRAEPVPFSGALLFACLFWLAWIAAPPLAAAAGWPWGELLRWPLHIVCHQDPERSIHLLGAPLAVCHRCTGLYIGFTLGVASWPWLPALAARLAANPRWVALFFVPMLIDWGLVPNTGASRFATGLVAAFPAALLPLLVLAERRAAANAPATPPTGVT